MLCRLLLVFVSLPLAVSYKCNYLDPVHEKDIHYDYYQISKLMKTIECPQLVKGGTTIYACYSRVDQGVIRMGCHGTKADAVQKELCEGAQESVQQKCNYDPTTRMGAFHPSPGNGICCCVGNDCNEPPPSWLVEPTPDELDTSVWLKDLAHFCFLLAVITIFTVVFILAAFIHHYLEKSYKKWTKKSSEKSVSDHGAEEETVEEKSAIEPSSAIFSGRNVIRAGTGISGGGGTQIKRTVLRSDIDRSPDRLQTPPSELMNFSTAPNASNEVPASTQRTGSAVRTTAARTAVAKSPKKSRRTSHRTNHQKSHQKSRQKSRNKSHMKKKSPRNSRLLATPKNSRLLATPKTSQTSTATLPPRPSASPTSQQRLTNPTQSDRTTPNSRTP